MRILFDDEQLKIVKKALEAAGEEARGVLIHVWGQEKESKDETNRKYVKAAQKHQKDGEIEIDDDAVVSTGFDAGAYVGAWLWIHKEELG